MLLLFGIIMMGKQSQMVRNGFLPVGLFIMKFDNIYWTQRHSAGTEYDDGQRDTYARIWIHFLVSKTNEPLDSRRPNGWDEKERM